MKKVFSFLAAAFMAVSMFADPVTVTFKDWGDTSPKSATDDTPNNQAGDCSTAYTAENILDSIDGASFFASCTEATKAYPARVGKGMKIGSSSATGKVALTLATPASFDSIVFVAASYSATEGSVKVMGGETVYDLTNGGTKNKVLTNIVYVPTAQVSSVTIETTEKRAFLKSIIFYPATGTTPDPQPATGIVYELNGGMFNPDGWMSEEDMYQGLAADVLAANGNGYTFTFVGGFGEEGHTQFGAADVSGATGLAYDISAWDMNFLSTYADGKWLWLQNYIQAKSEDAEKAWNSSAAMRYALTAFFQNSVRASWPASADYTNCGISSHLYFSSWGYTLGNPTEVAAGETVTLISPYKPGYIFAGWFDNANCAGTAVTTITSATTGTLYAKWEENTATEITYVLNGGVTNDYGWTNGSDMYQALAADVKAAKTDGVCSAFAFASDFTGTFGTPDVAGATGPAHDIQTFDLTFWTTAPYAEKWGWLADYLEEASTAAGQANNAKTNSAYARYSLAAFFGNTIRPNWPASADYTLTGIDALEAYQPYWKHSFDNPTQPTDTVALYAPYMEDYTFEGWYAAADFSGPKVVTVNPSTVGTLYAKFVEYIPTIKEIIAMEDSVTTKVKGTVNHIDGKTLYVTDATGGILVYAKTTPSCQIGDVITASGKKVIYCGAPEISGAEITATEAGRVADPINITIGELKLNPIKYLSQRVAITGVKIVSYDSYRNPTVKEGTDEVVCYKIALDTTAFPVGKKVNFTAVVGYHNNLQFVGNAADFELVIAAGHDATVYEDKVSVETGATYSIANDWLFSNYLGNFVANKPNPLAEQCRSMVVKDGIMYFPWRYGNSTTMNARLIRVDAQTGDMLDPLVLADSVMRQYTPMVSDTVITGTDTTITKTATGVWETEGEIIFASCSDLKLDEAGHAYLMNLQTGNIFTVWEIDLATGAAHNVIYIGGESGRDGLAKLFPDACASDNNIRIDRIGIYGDLHADGAIYGAQNANGNVFRFDFQNGVWDGQPVIIACAKPGDEGSAASFGDAPQVYPVEGGMFYVDGASTFPTLYDEDGNVMASFTTEEEKAVLLAADPNVNPSPNGVREFELNGEYFMIMAGSNYDAGDGQANSTTLIFKCKDANRNFDEMTPYWVLPETGMSQINRQGVDPQRVCVSHVDVDEANHTATIYIYAAEQGYGKYTITATPVSAVENVEAVETVKTIENGQVVIIRNGVKYSVLGAVIK